MSHTLTWLFSHSTIIIHAPYSYTRIITSFMPISYVSSPFLQGCCSRLLVFIPFHLASLWFVLVSMFLSLSLAILIFNILIFYFLGFCVEIFSCQFQSIFFSNCLTSFWDLGFEFFSISISICCIHLQSISNWKGAN